ncbi:uncharacterized protein J3D65DRAFT_612329 [Phyllosticta citribraziliensis]|uniref:Secreted protein n=1 Tax=Phyllosticta citribraziliensis TaxID=989973 RepID=A0ABR1M355_9PEZI
MAPGILFSFTSSVVIGFCVAFHAMMSPHVQGGTLFLSTECRETKRSRVSQTANQTANQTAKQTKRKKQSVTCHRSITKHFPVLRDSNPRTHAPQHAAADHATSNTTRSPTPNSTNQSASQSIHDA